jgi:hypothetical protein
MPASVFHPQRDQRRPKQPKRHCRHNRSATSNHLALSRLVQGAGLKQRRLLGPINELFSQTFVKKHQAYRRLVRGLAWVLLLSCCFCCCCGCCFCFTFVFDGVFVCGIDVGLQGRLRYTLHSCSKTESTSRPGWGYKRVENTDRINLQKRTNQQGPE